MSLEGSWTEITKIDERITRLDVHIPEVEEDEVVVALDLKEFSEAYPLRGGVT